MTVRRLTSDLQSFNCFLIGFEACFLGRNQGWYCQHGQKPMAEEVVADTLSKYLLNISAYAHRSVQHSTLTKRTFYSG